MRAFYYVKKNIRRTPYQALAASMVMFMTFFVLIMFAIIAAGSDRILQYYETKPQVIAFFKDGTTPEDVKLIQDSLNQTGKVSSTKYVSKEEAFKIYREDNKDKPELLELVTANYLPTSLDVSTFAIEDLGMVAEILKKEPVVEEVAFPRDLVQNLSEGTSFLRSSGIIITGFLILFGILILVMVIGFKIRIKRNEIETQRLLGASSNFIKAPFVLEGIFYGLVGAISGWVASYVSLWYFSPFLEKYLAEIPDNIITLPVPVPFMLGLLLVSIFIALFIGIIGSYGAVKRYLRI